MGLTARESDKCRSHLLQHNLQIKHTSLSARSRREFQISVLLRDFRDLLS